MVSRGRFRDAMRAIMLVGKIFPAAFSFPFSLLIFVVSGGQGYRTCFLMVCAEMSIVARRLPTILI